MITRKFREQWDLSRCTAGAREHVKTFARRAFAILLAFGLATSVSGQNVITTVAGAPKVFATGTPVDALTTSVAPSRVVTGPNDEVYFGDRETNIVLRLNPDGTLALVAGNGLAGFSGDGGPATSASLNQPAGLAVDRNGNLFIADVLNARIRRVDRNGIITTVAGNGAFGYSGDGGLATSASIGYFNDDTLSTRGHTPAQYAGGIALDNEGNLYIADSRFRVRKVGPDRIITTVAGGGSSGEDGGPATQAAIFTPNAVAVDASGNLFIGSSCCGPIRKVDTGGIITSIPGTEGFQLALAFDSSGNLYYSDFSRVIRVPQSGTPVTAASNLDFPFGIALDSIGNLFVTEDFGERVRKIDLSGNAVIAAGTGLPNFFGDGGPATGAGLSSPTAVAVDPKGIVAIADFNNQRIRRIDSEGVVSTWPGSAGLDYGLSPTLAFAPDGSILTTATIQGAEGIVKISPDGAVIKFAGFGQNPTPDGSPALGGEISVLSLASDQNGNVYFLDSSLPKTSEFTFTVRKIDPSGMLSTPGGGITASCTTLLHQCIAADAAGNVYVPAANSVIRISAVGGATTIPVQGVSAVSGIAADCAGNIYLSDVGDHDQIVKVSPGGLSAPFAGNNGYGFGGDGGPALKATLFDPVGLAVDNGGNLLIADAANGRIRKVFNWHNESENAGNNGTARESHRGHGPNCNE
jgi:sugar lactone lactonase YvrE